MNQDRNISESQINAFIDDELHDNDRAQMIDAINMDDTVAQRVNDIRKDMDLLRLAYNHPPLPRPEKKIHPDSKKIKLATALAASIFLFIGTIVGLLVSTHSEKVINPSFTAVNDFVAANNDNKKIMIHVSRLDDKKIVNALDKAEEILQYTQKSNKAVDLVLIANESGLGLLRQGSPYADRIHALSNKYKNVKFLACGIAMEVARLKEGEDVELLPDAEKIPAALTEILERLKGGWLYVKS